MFPQFYQKVFSAHLSATQNLTLQLLIILLQSHRQVSLARLAAVFPQPIKYESRVRNLQRFLNLPQLSVKLLWFPIVKQILKQAFRERQGNREQRRRAQKLKLTHQGYVLLVIDRTQWRERNLIMLSVIWGQHALPVYWEFLDKKGSSSLREQKRVFTPVLKLLRPYPVVVLADREFHSVQLADWLVKRKVDFALRQKKGTCIGHAEGEYQALKDLGIKPGKSKFIRNICCTKAHRLGSFHLAAYWKRKYRGRGPKEAWYILTTLPSLEKALCFYRARWGIETLFKDCKSGGYNLEKSQVNERRLLALILLMAIAYTLATFQGETLSELGVNEYLCRPTEPGRKVERHSLFSIGLHAPDWIQAFISAADLALSLMALKPHKRRYFQRGLQALAVTQSAF